MQNCVIQFLLFFRVQNVVRDSKIMSRVKKSQIKFKVQSQAADIGEPAKIKEAPEKGSNTELPQVIGE